MFSYIIVAEVFARFTNANKKNKGTQVGDHKIKTLVFLRDITCLNRIYKDFKLYEYASV